MAKDRVPVKTVFVCQQCGKESLRWLGRCPECQQWNSFAEKTAVKSVFHNPAPVSRPLEELAGVTEADSERLATNPELDRVLGGGLVPGSLALIGGDPGIGKSTLLLQASAAVAAQYGRVIYVSGEETAVQLKLRARRLGVTGENLFLLAESGLEAILGQLEEASPAMAVIDSIQTVYLPGYEGAPGSVGQVRECTLRIMQWAKGSGVPVLIAGHVTKDGGVAGPKTLEHIVDVVLYLEGESFSAYRLLRCVKNRFGSANEVGVFEMKERGLTGVDNPSLSFLAQRPEELVGSMVVPALEGSRPLLVEIQALTSPTAFGLPRRTANGVDFNRLLLIIAVLGKRAGLRLGNQDVIVNVTGGFRISEPAADLGVALAVASSLRDAVVDPEMVILGEVGLSGEIRPVAQLERRLAEAARLGFRRCLVPRARLKAGDGAGMELVPVGSVREAMAAGLDRSRKNL